MPAHRCICTLLLPPLACPQLAAESHGFGAARIAGCVYQAAASVVLAEGGGGGGGGEGAAKGATAAANGAAADGAAIAAAANSGGSGGSGDAVLPGPQTLSMKPLLRAIKAEQAKGRGTRDALQRSMLC